MEFRLLGDLQVVDGDCVVDIGPRQQQSLLALLLVHANRVVSTDRMLEHLWGDEGPGKESALWVYISRLRTALEPGRVERGESTVLLTRPPGYLLAIDVADYDVHQFEHLAAAGRASITSDPGAAREILGQALGLWRGPVLDGLGDEPLLQAETARLNEMRVDVIEDRIDADLACGFAGELVGELESLRQDHPLRERPVEQLMMSLYRSGRPAEALRAFERFRRMIGEELGIEPSPSLRRLEERILLHDDQLQRRPLAGERSGDTGMRVVNPFKGLRPFLENDADDFFGRDTLIADLVRAVGSGQRLLAVVGASGSGKSSVVRAGLIPALAKGAVPGSENWLIAYMVPGAHPFVEAEAALLRCTLDAPASLDEQFRDGDTGLLRAALRVLPGTEARLVLVIDQFEELFTLVDDDAVRGRFLSNLVTALDEPHGRVSVVLTLRADFYGRPLDHPEFGARLSGSVVNVTPLSSEELAAAALEPARRVGVNLEPLLLGELTYDVGAQPGTLPLFQYALTELFDRRADDTLLASSYHSMGGVQGALSRRASHLYEQLDDEHREAVRQLFLRLVTVGADSDQHGRRRVEAAEIVSLGVDTVVMEHVIGQFGEHRLLSFDADRLTGAPTVEVAHEALLTAWTELAGWIEESSDDLRRHTSLTVALHEWQLSGEHPDYLMTASRLAEYDDWSRSSTLTLTFVERAFLDAGFARRDEERAKEALRKRDEARSRRRLWGLVAALAASLGVAALFLLGVFDRDEGATVAFFGVRGDGSWNDNIVAGLDRAEQDLDMLLVDAPPVVDPAAEFRELAETGPDVIVSDSLPTYIAPEVFEDFPDIRFGIVDGVVDSPNTTYVSFANEQGAFLAGAAAAMKTETGVIGFIGGSAGVIDDFRAGYEAGAHWIDPDVEVLATYVAQPFVDQLGWVHGFVRADLGHDRATALYESGADVVFHAAGYSGWGLFDAVVEQSDAAGRHLWAIGVDNDQWFDVEEEARGHVLTSVIKRGDTAAYLLVEEMLGDEPGRRVLEVGLVDGAFDYSTQGGALTEEMTATLDRLEIEIAEGRIVVPSTPSGPVLNLDPAQNAIEEALGDLAPAEIVEYVETWLAPRYPDEVAACTEAGLDMACAQLMIDHRGEWEAT